MENNNIEEPRKKMTRIEKLLAGGLIVTTMGTIAGAKGCISNEKKVRELQNHLNNVKEKALELDDRLATEKKTNISLYTQLNKLKKKK